jgi:hypothetical protein
MVFDIMPLLPLVGALVLEVELSIFPSIISAFLEVDTPIRLELCLLTQRIVVSELGTKLPHVENPTSHQQLMVSTHGHFP